MRQIWIGKLRPKGAKYLRREIVASIASLETFTNAHPDIEGLAVGKASIKRMPVDKGRYFVVYKVEGDEITIYDVIDSRKDNSILKL